MLAQGRQPAYDSGECEVDLVRRELWIDGVLVPISGRAFEIIETLVQASGELVTKDSLMDRVWSGAIVEDNTLQVHISAVRKALGSRRAMLKTEFGRGYRLLGNWTARKRDVAMGTESAEPPRTQPLRSSTNFPVSSTNLIGRSTAVQQLRDFLSAYRLVTLTGPGGIGKTALSLEVARSVLSDFDGGGWLVELASLSDPELLPATVAGILDLRLTGGVVSAETVARAIGTRKLLLVLDNCEHLVDAAAELAETILRQSLHTTILATSREVLRIDGEYVYRVPPLVVPPRDRDEPEHLLENSAVELFIARSKALNSGFALDRENLAPIAAICRRLDGIPLAIEFAAARGATLGVQQVALGLEDRFGLLTSGRRTALPRHQTLRAALDWSYQLLSSTEQRLLCHLARFSGGFTIEAAAAVVEDGAEAAIARGISDLVAKSLVMRDPLEAAGRWRLLETIRTYALDKLAGNAAAAAAQRHAVFFRDLVGSAIGDAVSDPSAERLTRCFRELDNIRVALDWALSPAGDASIGVTLTVDAVPLWTHLSLTDECRRRVEEALDILRSQASPDMQQEMQLLAALGSAHLLTTGTTPKAHAAWMRALEIAESLGDSDYRLRALWGLYVHCLANRNYRPALAFAEQFRSVAIKASDVTVAAIGDRMIGLLLHMLGDQAAARLRLEPLLLSITTGKRWDLIRFQLDQRMAANCFLSRVLWLQGYADQAARTSQTCIDAAQAADHPTSMLYGLAFGACPIALFTGDLEAAGRFVNTLVELADRHPITGWNVWGQCFRGVLLIKRGETATGLRLLQPALGGLSKSAFHMHYSALAAVLAEALGQVGEAAQGLVTIDEALERCERDEEGWCLAELLRVKGELILIDGAIGAGAAAEDHFRRSLETARRQEALSWELRTATSLARHRINQGRRDDAIRGLAPVYNRFTEGFETADLRAAACLLDPL